MNDPIAAGLFFTLGVVALGLALFAYFLAFYEVAMMAGGGGVLACVLAIFSGGRNG